MDSRLCDDTVACQLQPLLSFELIFRIAVFGAVWETGEEAIVACFKVLS